MINNVSIGLNSGHLHDPNNIIVNLNESKQLSENKIVYITTGGQGEVNSVIGLISSNKHPELRVNHGDTIVLSSEIIPGNEISVGKVIDNLSRQGANVIYNKLHTVHVSGHGRSEELRLMIAITKPQHFLPLLGK